MYLLNVKNISKVCTGVKMVELNGIEIENKILLDGSGKTSGELFGLLGANGAGKTTLIRLISTLLLPTKGEIELDGQRLSRAKIDLKSQITTVTQEYSLRNDMTVLEVMELQGRLYHMESKLRKQGSETLLKKCGLWEYRNQNTRQLSGGYKRMLMLCRALLPNPKIVLLDEPTVGLDPFARRMMWQMIRDLHHQGLTFILTTHYMEEAQMLCHRVAFMRKGCVLGVKTPEDWILQLGRFAVDHFENETVKTYYFNCKKEAITYTEHLSSDFLLRETNLEDVFLETVGKGIPKKNGNFNCYLGKMD